MAWMKWLRRHRLASDEAETTAAMTPRTAFSLQTMGDFWHAFWSSSSGASAWDSPDCSPTHWCWQPCSGFFPNPRQDMLRARKSLAESTAIGVALLADRADTNTLQRYVEAIMKRSGDVVSVEVRDQQGQRLLAVGTRSNGPESNGHGRVEVEGTRCVRPGAHCLRANNTGGTSRFASNASRMRPTDTPGRARPFVMERS